MERAPEDPLRKERSQKTAYSSTGILVWFNQFFNEGRSVDRVEEGLGWCGRNTGGQRVTSSVTAVFLSQRIKRFAFSLCWHVHQTLCEKQRKNLFMFSWF